MRKANSRAVDWQGAVRSGRSLSNGWLRARPCQRKPYHQPYHGQAFYHSVDRSADIKVGKMASALAGKQRPIRYRSYRQCRSLLSVYANRHTGDSAAPESRWWAEISIEILGCTQSDKAVD